MLLLWCFFYLIWSSLDIVNAMRLLLLFCLIKSSAVCAFWIPTCAAYKSRASNCLHLQLSKDCTPSPRENVPRVCVCVLQCVMCTQLITWNEWMNGDDAACHFLCLASCVEWLAICGSHHFGNHLNLTNKQWAEHFTNSFYPFNDRSRYRQLTEMSFHWETKWKMHCNTTRSAK